MAIISATGTARKRTIPALAAFDSVEVVAVHGRNRDKLDALADEYGIPDVFTDLDELLALENVDLLFVASPPFLHEEHISRALTARRPIICEKPLTSDLASASRVAEMVRTAGISFVVAHHLRHHPMLARVKSLIDDATIGRAYHADLEWSFRLDHKSPNASWKLDSALGGPTAFHDAGIHALDLALHLFGVPPRVFGTAFAASSTTTQDHARALLIYPQLAVGVTASQVSRLAPNTLTVEGDAGYIVAPGLLGEAGGTRLEIHTSRGVEIENFDPIDLYGAEVEAFVRCLNTGQPHPGTTLDEALAGMRLLDGLDASCRAGTVVDIE
jgi:1,5-anhydro-D-fructose reductase (1,5-anhydro-D-mannitol-forming)